MKTLKLSTMAKRFPRLSILSLLLVTIICSLLLAELPLRFVFKAWPFEGNIELANLTSRDAVLRYRFSPGNGRNSLGLRNKEVTEKKNQFRVLFLGDSLVWSGGTSSGELYTQVIEKNLNNDMERSGREVEVVNAGIPGYTTYQELEFLKIYGLGMNPDLVILGFVQNDLFYKYLHTPTEGKMLGGHPGRRLNRFDTDIFPGSLFAQSHLAHEIVYAWDLVVKRLTKATYYPFDYRGDFYLAWKDYAWKKENKLILEMNNLLKENGIKFIIVSFPIRDQVNDKYLQLNRDYVLFPMKKMKELCSRYGIPFLDLTESIYRNGGTELFIDYLHLNPRGNDVVAREITQYLSSELTPIRN